MIPRGRTRYVLVASPSEDQSREFVGLCAGIVEGSPLLGPMADVKADRIDFRLPSGAHAAIRALAANSRSVRGMSASLVIVDEFAHFTDTAGPASDERLFAALEPSLRVFRDAARMVVISTPHGETGKFFELCQAVDAGGLPGGRLTRAATSEIDPSLGEDWKERKRAEIGEDTFRQEYGAEFVAGAGQFFDLREVEKFAEAPARPRDAMSWTVGTDAAFHSDRFGVVLVGEAAGDAGTFLTGAVDAIDPGERRRSLEARRAREDETLARVWEVIEPYAAERPVRVWGDQHQSDGLRSFFRHPGLNVEIVNVTAPIQTAGFVSLRARLLDGSLRLWKHPLLIEELRRVRTAKTAESIMLPRFGGGHCDAASALALAAYALREGDLRPAAAPTRPSGRQSQLSPDERVWVVGVIATTDRRET